MLEFVFASADVQSAEVDEKEDEMKKIKLPNIFIGLAEDVNHVSNAVLGACLRGVLLRDGRQCGDGGLVDLCVREYDAMIKHDKVETSRRNKCPSLLTGNPRKSGSPPQTPPHTNTKSHEESQSSANTEINKNHVHVHNNVPHSRSCLVKLDEANTSSENPNYLKTLANLRSNINIAEPSEVCQDFLNIFFEPDMDMDMVFISFDLINHGDFESVNPFVLAGSVCEACNKKTLTAWGYYLRELGHKRFVATVRDFWEDLKVGETVKNRIGALDARLAKAVKIKLGKDK